MSVKIIGVCHLPALPGSPRHALAVGRIVDRAVRDARALKGVDAIIVENFGDLPFSAAAAEPQVVSVMTRAALAVRESAGVPVGINVLRNDAVSALAIAMAAEASFIRVNVLTGVYVSGEGLLTGNAAEVLRYRSRISADVRIYADLLVKHAAPLGPIDLTRLARDTAERGGADALIVTGSATGEEPDLRTVGTIRDAVPDRPLYIGSGLNEGNAEALLRLADGAIIGSVFETGGRAGQPVDRRRVRRLLGKIRR